MIMGYGIIAVPTGIVTVELANAARAIGLQGDPLRCRACGLAGHDADARHCKHCGLRLGGED
jgi:voltage-gated potassium channel